MSYRTFIIEWKYEDIEKGIDLSRCEEYKVKRIKNSDAEVQLALLYVFQHYKNDTQPRWQSYFHANHAFIWDKPREFMYCHAALSDFTEHGIRANKVEI